MSKLIHYSGPAGSILLPSGYTRLAYIESTGILWIDTGYKVSGNGTLVVQGKILATNTSGERDWIGNYNVRGFVTGLQNGRQYSFKKNDNSRGGIGQGTFNANQIYDHLAIYDALLLKLITNGATYTAPVTGNVANSQNIALFRRGDNNCYWIGRIYKATIWFNDLIVRDFVPVKRTSDNEIGMLDLCNNIFYGSLSNIFIAGPEIPQGFPTSEYCLVEWLETDGSLIINVDVSKVTVQNLDILAEGTASVANKDIGFFFKGTYQNSFLMWLWYNSATSVSLIYNGNTRVNLTASLIGKFDISIRNTTMTYNGTSYTLSGRTNMTLGTKFSFFKNFTGKLYYVKLYDEGNKLTNYLIPCYRRSDMMPGIYDIELRKFYAVSGASLGPSITFGWGEVINNVGVEAHPMLGTLYTETNKFTHTGNSKDSFKTLPVYQRVEPGQLISISFDTDVTLWASHHDISGGTTNKGKWSMFIYFNKVYNNNNNNNNNYNSAKWYAASLIKSLGGTRWKYSFTVPADMHMIRLRTNLYSDGSTSYTAHFWNFNWSFGDTGCQVNPLHAIPHNISTGDGRNGEKNGAFIFNGLDTYMTCKTPDLASVFNSLNWTVAFWCYPTNLTNTWQIPISYGATNEGNLYLILHVRSNTIMFSTYGTDWSVSPTLVNNTWYHIAYVYRNGLREIWLNGVKLGEKAYSITNIDASDTSILCIGKDYHRNQYPYYGRIYDLQIWNEVKNPAELM